ncbi:MAG: alpha/beta hydrolase-fold protein [Spirochaetales bacterium]|nr:alpha/beta hydrolase-fold protein [Spirochaetales bacterium]
MKNKIIIILMMILCIAFSGCTTKKSDNEGSKSFTRVPDIEIQKQIEEANGKDFRIIDLSYYSRAISSNTIGDTPTRTVSVYLPPDYFDNDHKTYPVIYFLDGYECNAKSFLRRNKVSLDKAFNEKNAFLMVAVDGNNISGGSFYVNSPVSGNWEDYLSQELVSLIDNNFRSKPGSQYRGLSGYSMGGFGALYTAFRHPDIFGSVMVFAPGAFAEEDIDMVMKSWRGDRRLLTSYAQAFSPDAAVEKNQGNIPSFDGSDSDQIYVDNWLNGFSGWQKKIDNYLGQQARLNAIAIAYSESDYYKWIPGGCKHLDKLLTDSKIEHEIYNYKGGHIVPRGFIESYYTPFFGAVFNK